MIAEVLKIVGGVATVITLVVFAISWCGKDQPSNSIQLLGRQLRMCPCWFSVVRRLGVVRVGYVAGLAMIAR